MSSALLTALAPLKMKSKISRIQDFPSSCLISCAESSLASNPGHEPRTLEILTCFYFPEHAMLFLSSYCGLHLLKKAFHFSPKFYSFNKSQLKRPLPLGRLLELVPPFTPHNNQNTEQTTV